MKEWEELSYGDLINVWFTVKERFKFNPKFDSPFLNLPEPFNIYDMHLFESYKKDESIVIDEEFYDIFNNYITEIMIKCMGEEDFLYALDWEHPCFKYNPKSSEKMPRMLETSDRNLYFPDFYPDGDYYFFIAKDFSWGYFTHPWKQQLWAFGKEMLEELKKVPSIYLTLRV